MEIDLELCGPARSAACHFYTLSLLGLNCRNHRFITGTGKAIRMVARAAGHRFARSLDDSRTDADIAALEYLDKIADSVG